MIDIITDRLVIRNFKIDDWQDLYEYLSSDEVLKYEPESANTKADCMQKSEDRSKDDVFLAVCLKETGKLIGHIYFNQASPEHFLYWELGYIFNPSYYGSGYATEAAKAVVKYGFEELCAHRIVAFTNTENEASWKLLERLGMRREATRYKNAYFDRDEDGNPLWFDSYQYAILDEEFFRKKKILPRSVR